MVWSSFILGALAFLFWGLALWVVLYVMFVPEAITMAQEKPLRAVAASFAVVRSSFWSTLGLIVLVNLAVDIAYGLVDPRIRTE